MAAVRCSRYRRTVAHIPDPGGILLSVKPVYADLILTGFKTVELRRVFPEVQDAVVYLYASSPVKRVIGRARIQNVDRDHPDEIWRRHQHQTGLTRDTFDAYFTGARSAAALVLTDPERLRGDVSLGRLRALNTPPSQSFRYLRAGSDVLQELRLTHPA